MWECNEHSNLHHIGVWADALPADSATYTELRCPLQLCGRDDDGALVQFAYHRDPLGVRIELVDIGDEAHDGRVHVQGAASLTRDESSPPVKIVFLGGLGEIGRNCFCLEVDDRILVVDCGIMFPEADMPGIDLVLPDFTYLRENADRVEAAFLTHAHEDHAGGLAFLLRDVSFPIYGSPLSLGLARNRIEEAGMLGRTELIPVHDGERRHDRPVRLRVHPRHALGAARVRHRVPHARRHDPAQRRLQARPHAGRRPQDRPRVDGRRSPSARAA